MLYCTQYGKIEIVRKLFHRKEIEEQRKEDRKEEGEEEDFSSDDLRRLTCLLCGEELAGVGFGKMGEHLKVNSTYRDLRNKKLRGL